MSWIKSLLKKTSLLVSETDLRVIEPRDVARHSKIKRALARGDLIRIRRGLYCLSAEYRKEEVNAYVLSNMIYAPSFVSLESALSYHGLIPEAVYTTTALSARRSSEFRTPVGLFSYQYSKTFKMIGVLREGHGNQHFLIASPLRAIFDYVHVNNLKWNTIEPLIQSLRIEPHELKAINLTGIEALAKSYTNPFIEALARELLAYV